MIMMKTGQTCLRAKALLTEKLLTTTLLGAALATAAPAFAQTPQAAAQPETIPQSDQGPSDTTRVIVTGSRIPRTGTDTTTAAPVTVVDSQDLTDRGFVQAGDALNEVTNIPPSRPVGGFDGSGPGLGTQYPSLFNLGPGRTLTLVNGRRYVSSSGLGENLVDTNSIPTGLLDRIEIVQGGGAAIYGSDAIAGVVNYILKDNFTGLQADAQFGDSERKDYPSQNARITWGADLGGRGNIAANLEWSKTAALWTTDRPEWTSVSITQTNPANTSNTDGIPAVTYIPDPRFWEFNFNGILFAPPDPAGGSCGNFPLRCFITTNGLRYNQFNPAGGIPAQFSNDGQTLVGYNPGTFISPGPSIPTSSGGQGFPFTQLNALTSPVERLSFNVLNHFDISDHIKFSSELLFASTEGSNPQGTPPSNSVLNSAATGSGAIAIRADNPYLTASARQTIVTYLNSNPSLFGPNSGFGWQGGAPIPVSLSKIWYDLVPDNSQVRESNTYRIAAALDGDFDAWGRSFTWQLSASQSGSDTSIRSWDVWAARFARAIDTRTFNGSPACAVNANVSTTDDDPACAPLNPFGIGNVSAAARDYVSIEVGQNTENVANDYLASLGGSLFALPAGDVGFNIAYEHREENARFTPTNATRLGLGRGATPVVGQEADYHTNEYSAEVLVPLIGGDFSFPLVKAVELNAAYRFVDNSIAGEEDVWGTGLRWDVIDGLLFRASRSRNFRAPTLNQLFAPSTTGLAAIGQDPCDADRIAQGPAPAVRAANCLALFQANPGYGTGATAAARLASFQDPAENFPNTLITTGGNSSLRNEISDTTSFGVVFQPTFVPGLTLVADRIEVDLADGLSAFTPASFLATCFDSSPQPADICAISTRDAAGTVITSRTTTFNAGLVKYRGEIYNANYQFDIADLIRGADLGRLEFALEATHNDLLETSVTGFDRSRTSDTIATPDWVYRFDTRYDVGPVRLAYTVNYRPAELRAENASIETSPTPVVDANWLHSLSARYDVNDNLSLRAGIQNLTDEGPSFSTTTYGDILGRRFFIGLTANY
jgi:iron complex outermembrane recepter protein